MIWTRSPHFIDALLFHPNGRWGPENGNTAIFFYAVVIFFSFVLWNLSCVGAVLLIYEFEHSPVSRCVVERSRSRRFGQVQSSA